MVISLSGSLRTISPNILASKAMMPLSAISPSMVVSIPSSISLAVRVITPLVASIRIHSRIDMVVLLGTALDTICTPPSRLDLEQISFISYELLSRAQRKNLSRRLRKAYIILLVFIISFLMDVDMCKTVSIILFFWEKGNGYLVNNSTFCSG